MSMRALSMIGAFAALFMSFQVKADLCESWSEPETVGSLDSELVPEASGLAASERFPERLYHINDKGNETVIVMTKLDGSAAQEIKVKGLSPIDTEELALGPCSEGSCLYIGDIGDNTVERDSITIAWIAEKAKYGSVEKVLGRVTLHYPDGPHNAEGMVVHPNGDLFIFTKGSPKIVADVIQPSYVYKISTLKLRDGRRAAADLEYVGAIDIPKILKNEDPENQLVTGAAVSQSGDKLLLLTYRNFLEIDWDFTSALKAPAEMRKGVDFSVIKLDVLPKQEAIAFIPGTDSILVTTEVVKKKKKKKKDPEFVSLTCEG